MLQSPLDHTTGHPSGEVEPHSPDKYFACVKAAPIDSRESLKLRDRDPLGTFARCDSRRHFFHTPWVSTSYVLTSSSSRKATRLRGSARNSCREDVTQDINEGSRTTGVGIAENILVATPLTYVCPVRVASRWLGQNHRSHRRRTFKHRPASPSSSSASTHRASFRSEVPICR